MTSTFSAQLRQQTWPHHQRASRTEFVKGLLNGRGTAFLAAA